MTSKAVSPPSSPMSVNNNFKWGKLLRIHSCFCGQHSQLNKWRTCVLSVGVLLRGCDARYRICTVSPYTKTPTTIWLALLTCRGLQPTAAAALHCRREVAEHCHSAVCAGACCPHAEASLLSEELREFVLQKPLHRPQGNIREVPRARRLLHVCSGQRVQLPTALPGWRHQGPTKQGFPPQPPPHPLPTRQREQATIGDDSPLMATNGR